MTIQYTTYERPRRLASSIHMPAADIAGTLRFDPVANGTRMSSSWVVRPRGLYRLLAVDSSWAALVVLVDAAADGDPGAVSVRWVQPRRPDPATWSHHLDPESLAGLAKDLYGAVPPIVLVSVAAGSFAGGDRLSGALERALPDVVEVVADVVGGQHRA